ncbi:uncharacterized protein PV06_01994 [Exophiala oligosperma]|uniref:Putative lipoate-protein ligase A n=1 Tax=Exophiala oligosperma TaxID=215243 RepID=A0A0D2DUR8_9EURO|nr:uncharacterized protein PV06_01994 [Exophiala oligosperma]KIW46315.1 hypothetical protein PV06_01994 [Exophiala oligosperma]
MRTASTRALNKSTCLLHQLRKTESEKTFGLRRKSFTHHAVSRRSITTTTTTTSTSSSWNLRDLSRVSEETSPLIFHLTSDNPYHNLSIEHYLLTHSHPESRLLLFYTNRPCVVIGRNQNPWLETDLNALRRGLVPEQGQEEAIKPTDRRPPGNLDRQRGNGRATTPVDLVRRRSGGGTVFHDSGNLNYSVIVPNSKSFKRGTHAEMVVRALLSSPGAAASYGSGDIRVNDRNDIVMRRAAHGQPEWLKVSGSAYKLTRGRALHHGTLLYSSPYIHKISELLRSPGGDLIDARGVESVRSPVGNLAWTADRRRRDTLRGEITRHIIREFWLMYGGGGGGVADHGRMAGIDEVTLGPEECDHDKNPEIADGVRELMSNEWRFEQTPRFEFASGVLDGAEVELTANRAVVERLALHEEFAGGERSERPRSTVEWDKTDFDGEIKLHDVQSWKRVLGGQNRETESLGVSDALVKRIEAIFPSWPA